MKVAIRKSTREVTDGLAEIGLTTEIVLEAIREGEAGRNSCTANDPKCLPGVLAWGRAVRSLRDQLIPRGWDKNDDGNFPTVVSPNEKIAIAVATGDSGTGKADATPKTKYSKGVAVEAAISRNLYSMFPEIRAEAEAEKEKLDNKQTWILLKRRVKDTVYAELSLPASLRVDEQVKDWLVRIIFDPIVTAANVEVVDDTADEPLDIPIRRRS